MRVAVVSDIHANIQALEAVGKDIDEQHVDAIWCLGDVVGYGANPLECLAWVEAKCGLTVKGNHDEAVATGDVAWFNPLAAQAARLHAQRLTPPERARLYALPEERRLEADHAEVLVVHASPDDPLHEYVQPADARLGLRRWQGRANVILLGHTHRPFFAANGPAPTLLHPTPGAWAAEGFTETIRETAHHAPGTQAGAASAPLVIVNPGSVGQPRDGDPRASYAILDFARHRAHLRRVPYDVEAAAQAIMKEGLDTLLALRLYDGR